MSVSPQSRAPVVCRPARMSGFDALIPIASGQWQRLWQKTCHTCLQAAAAGTGAVAGVKASGHVCRLTGAPALGGTAPACWTPPPALRWHQTCPAGGTLPAAPAQQHVAWSCCSAAPQHAQVSCKSWQDRNAIKHWASAVGCGPGANLHIALMQCARDNEDDVVDHVTICAVVKEFAHVLVRLHSIVKPHCRTLVATNRPQTQAS